MYSTKISKYKFQQDARIYLTFYLNYIFYYRIGHDFMGICEGVHGNAYIDNLGILIYPDTSYRFSHNNLYQLKNTFVCKI